MKEQIYPKQTETRRVGGKNNVKAIGTRYGEVELSPGDVAEAGNLLGQDLTDLTGADQEDPKLN